MINKMKHYKWYDGKVGILIKQDWLEVFQLSGKALPAGLLPALVDRFLSKEDIETINKLNSDRENNVAVQLVSGQYGSKTYVLKALVDEDKNIIRSVASLHISSGGKLNYGVYMWIGDLAPILEEMGLEFHPCEFEEVPILKLNWKQPQDIKELSDFLSPSKYEGKVEVQVGCKTVHRLRDGIEIDGKRYGFGYPYELDKDINTYIFTNKEEVLKALEGIGVKLEIDNNIFNISPIAS